MNERFMRRAIALSRRGFPAPNPHVGCVVVQAGQIVGEGFHDHAGGPHAERVALTSTRGSAKGADVYVTLEPCNHTGRTGPCTEALIAAGVARVFVACKDPNPIAAGGEERLRDAGIEVQTGILEAEAAGENRQFLDSMNLRRPVVTVKAAMSLDGRIALPSGESKWITGEASRRAAHRLRAECGAVLVGYRTVIADDPELTARLPGVKNQPLRIVLDPHGRLTGKERVFNERARTLSVTGEIDLGRLLQTLFEDGVRGLLVEGGARTIGGFFRQGLVDRLELFVAPKLLGSGPAWLEGLEIGRLADSPKLRISKIKRISEDLQISAIPIWE